MSPFFDAAVEYASAVDLETAEQPEFDPSLHVFHCARVHEIPTPHWTTIQAEKLGAPPRHRAMSDKHLETRSSEFVYANDEVIPAWRELNL